MVPEDGMPLPPPFLIVECHGAARRQDSPLFQGEEFWSCGLSVLTPRLKRRGAGKVESAAATDWSSINSPHHFPTMSTKQPSFSERTKAMRLVADNLLATANLLGKFAEDIAAEAERMVAAQTRFAERRSGRNAKAERS